jgi:hypothetical protein
VDGAFDLARGLENHYVRAVTLFRLAIHHSDKSDVEQALAVASIGRIKALFCNIHVY